MSEIKKENVLLLETFKIALGCVILSIPMLIVFFVLNLFNIKVVIGSLVGIILATANFYMMGHFLQKAMNKNTGNVKSIVSLSYSGRMLIVFLFVIAFTFFKIANPVAMIIPLFFPRITIFVRHVLLKKPSEEEQDG